MSTLKIDSIESLDGTYSISTKDITPIGVGQIWQDVESSRTLGTIYTNTTGKPIEVSVVGDVVSSEQMDLVINGIVVGIIRNVTSSTIYMSITATVPNGNTYSFTATNGAPSLVAWSELR